uniref:Retrotransposon gag domain-containing protein n=1 Tax=Chromera velia CCMP2878 TaxID=1169474 RepID=A0A0G4GMH5_9ALVE|eukprot:Cvel_22559.t1-p1 / transcript=Cvel_22559.t1 / gene=Cvel_22559 / organism=Chromera_velia_CCMP2878 / gene_product=hypothetical protein / transcript_product=hypothetical protein / location=Cvel_scaffold2228:8805-10026(-) / protein_length=150 / sequence_SO=supercontig / SO=protein_coding / is_pseudo=false
MCSVPQLHDTGKGGALQRTSPPSHTMAVVADRLLRDVSQGVREKAERWCTDMNDWFANAQTAPERQLSLAKSYLSPELKDWFDLVKLENGIRFCDWPALKDTLLRRYRDKHVCRAAKKKIAILKCTGTISDYNNKFDVEALKLKKAGTSE